MSWPALEEVEDTVLPWQNQVWSAVGVRYRGVARYASSVSLARALVDKLSRQQMKIFHVNSPVQVIGTVDVRHCFACAIGYTLSICRTAELRSKSRTIYVGCRCVTNAAVALAPM
jgi:hypothetical protein